MFDPTFPLTNADLLSLPFRNQFQSLKALIDATPGLTDVVIDSVTTLPPGEAATVAASVTGTVLHLSFGIPQGSDGPQGPPFATCVVDGVNTLPAGDPATVDAIFDGTAVRFTFGIPAGAAGSNGVDGEVSMAAMTTAISDAVNTTSANSNAVGTLDVPFADPDAEALRQSFNELVLALRR